MSSFTKLAGSVKEGWSEHEKETYHEAVAEFNALLHQRSCLGRSLASARASIGLTQIQLSELTGIDQAEISRIERGLSNPTLDTFTQLALPLGLRLKVEPQPLEEPHLKHMDDSAEPVR